MNRLAVPAILAGIAEPVISLIDTAFIGHIGTAALGGIGIGASLFMLLVWVLTQTKTAISAIVSQHYGAGTLEKAKPLIPQTLLFVVLLGMVVSLMTTIFSIPLLKLYAASGDVLKEADLYFSIRAWGFPLVLGTFTIFGVFRGIQNTSWAMLISIGGGLLNLVLDLILIFGVEGYVPALGVAGAAYASISAQGAMLIAAVFTLRRRTPFKRFYLRKPSPDFLRMLGLSSGFIIRTLALNLTFFLANRYATSYGDEYIAAHTIAVNIWLFSSYFIDGYANAGNALAGRLLGGKDHTALYSVGNRLLGISIGIGSGLAFVYLLLYPWLGGVFSDDPEVIRLFENVFWMVIIAQPLNAVAFSFDGIFKGLGRAKYLMTTLLIASFLGFLPILFITDLLDWKLYGIWSAFILMMLIRGVTLWWKFRKDFRP